MNGVPAISRSQNYKKHALGLSENLDKILKYTLKISTNEFNFSKAVGENMNFDVGFCKDEK